MRVLRRRWFELTAGVMCFLWALAGWLTVVPNQDILANAIQAQSLLSDPRIVLAFPGQKHGGPLELPFLLVGEAVAPGNYYTLTAASLLLAFLTGFVTAALYLRLIPEAPRWSFLLVMAVGPTIIHGLLGPAENPVGVWWLQPNWDTAWLAVTAGALALAFVGGDSNSPGVRPRALSLLAVLAGLLVGMGFFAHPAIILLIVPLISLVFLRVRVTWRTSLWAGLGAVVGMTPAAISYFVNAGVNTWDPSHGPFFVRSLYLAALGLDGIPDYSMALLPYSIGMAPSDSLLNGSMKSVLTWLFLALVGAVAAVGLLRAARYRRRPSVGTAIATSWCVAAGTIVVFATLVDPVWIYSSGLAILFWISAGALPVLVSPRWLGRALTLAVVAVVAASTLTHNSSWYRSFGERMEAKWRHMDETQDLASNLLDEGAEYVYGSYYDAIPVGYASGHELRTITNHYNRFPLSADEAAAPELQVAVNTEPTDSWGEEALLHVQSECFESASSNTPFVGGFRVYSCPGSALADGSG